MTQASGSNRGLPTFPCPTLVTSWRSSPVGIDSGGPTSHPREGETGPGMLTVEEATEQIDFFVDVIDWRAGRLVARRHLDGMFVGGFLGSDELYTVESDPQYNLSLRTWRIVLEGNAN
jgi:hypothetical protein